MGVYAKEPLSYNGQSDELLFTLYKPLIRLLNSKAVKNHAK